MAETTMKFRFRGPIGVETYTVGEDGFTPIPTGCYIKFTFPQELQLETVTVEADPATFMMQDLDGVN